MLRPRASVVDRDIRILASITRKGSAFSLDLAGHVRFCSSARGHVRLRHYADITPRTISSNDLPFFSDEEDAVF